MTDQKNFLAGDKTSNSATAARPISGNDPTRVPGADLTADQKGDADAVKTSAQRAQERIDNSDEELITQKKPLLSEGMGAPLSMDSIGKGSVTETAPAVRGTTEAQTEERVVQQGDDVVVHTSTAIDGATTSMGKVSKVNQDGTLNVLVLRGNGNTFPVERVYPSRQASVEPWWSWPGADQQAFLDQQKQAAG